MATKRGPKSKGDLSVVQMTGTRLACPDHLTPAQQGEWRGIVDSLPADYFRPSDIPLLAAFCVASALYKKAAEMIEREGIVLAVEGGGGKTRMQPHPAKDILTSQACAMAQMSTKLRLTPQSRYSEKSASTKAKQPAGAKRPWEDPKTGTE